jgi:hypothetical protein
LDEIESFSESDDEELEHLTKDISEEISDLSAQLAFTTTLTVARNNAAKDQDAYPTPKSLPYRTLDSYSRPSISNTTLTPRETHNEARTKSYTHTEAPPSSSKSKRKYKTDKHLDSSNVLTSKRPRPSANAIQTYWNGFAAASLPNNKPHRSSVDAPSKIHRDKLPSSPRFYKDIADLLTYVREGFYAAARKEIKTIYGKDTYTVLPTGAVQPGTEIIPLMWVFSYKFDGNYLLKFKARIVVRGDMQTTVGDTHTTTPATRIFRALMAITCYFNIVIQQLDAVNAFTNAELPFPIFTWEPDGFKTSGVWQLHKALYSLTITSTSKRLLRTTGLAQLMLRTPITRKFVNHHKATSSSCPVDLSTRKRLFNAVSSNQLLKPNS